MLDRRHFLGGGAAAVFPSAVLATASPPASTSASAALAAAIEAAREIEDPKLLQIGEELAEARERFDRAVTVRWEAEDAALATAPRIPDGLAVPFGSSIFGSIGWYGLPEPADILGEPIELARFTSPKSGKQLPVRVPTAADIIKDRLNDRRNARWLGRKDRLPAWHRGEHRRLYDLAVACEAEIDRCRERSGLNDAEIEHMLAGTALVKLCSAAVSIEAQSLAGIVIQARAIDACADVDSEASRNAAYRGSYALPFAICAVLGCG